MEKNKNNWNEVYKWTITAIVAVGQAVLIAYLVGLQGNCTALQIPCSFVVFLGCAVGILLSVIIVHGIWALAQRIWTSNSFLVPKISVRVESSEVSKLFKVIEKIIDQRSKVLKKAGLQVEKSISKDGVYAYRFSYVGHLIYHFSMMPYKDFGPNSIGFSDGWNEPRPGTFTAFGKIAATLDTLKPTVSLTSNLSFIVDSFNGLPLRVQEISYADLAELIWENASRIIESGMRSKRR